MMALTVPRWRTLPPNHRDETAVDDIVCQPIGVVVGGRLEILDDNWGGVSCIIRLDQRFGPDCLSGLQDFSHVEVVFFFDRVPEEKIETAARQPRGRKDWPLVGIFAQRGKNRPNRLGVSRARIRRIDGLDLQVEGLDAIEGTPVLDLKPVMREFEPRGGIRQPGWATELMQDYHA